MNENYAAIAALLERYFDLLYEGDASLIDAVFHPQAHVFSASDGQVVDADIAAFRQRIENRKPPAATAEHREDRILSIDIAAPTIALARVDLYILPSGHFTDYLTLLKTAQGWRIISKVFHVAPAKP